MMDFNSSSSISGQVTAWSTPGCSRPVPSQSERQYLGASRLGVACERALQFEYAKAPSTTGATPRADAAHLRAWPRHGGLHGRVAAGCGVRPAHPQGRRRAVRLLGGRRSPAGPHRRRHRRWPEGFAYPALWECKCLGNKSWRDWRRRAGVAKPVYAAQVAIYQAYLELHEHPAIFTALNADTMEIYTELVPFDAALAQRMSDRAVKVITATEAGELLPRAFNDPTHFECRMCAWQDRCWRKQHEPFPTQATWQWSRWSMRQAGAARCALPLLLVSPSRCARFKYRIPHYRVGQMVRFRTIGAGRHTAGTTHEGGTSMLDFNDTPNELPAQSRRRARDELRAELLARLESVLATLFPAGKKRKGQVPDRRRAGQPRRQPRGGARWREGRAVDGSRHR
jgi:hypothetical protein